MTEKDFIEFKENIASRINIALKCQMEGLLNKRFSLQYHRGRLGGYITALFNYNVLTLSQFIECEAIVRDGLGVLKGE